MAEPTKVEGTEEKSVPVVTIPAPTLPAKDDLLDLKPAVETPEDDDREPGGTDPQAVRARKEYRQRKRYEHALVQEREARIAAEARATALADARRTSPQQERRYTSAELQQAVDAGTITGIEAADYLARVNAEDVGARIVNSERLRYDNETRRDGAVNIVQQYAAELPWINDPSDARVQKLQQEYNRLTDPNGLYRLPKEPSTDILVLERLVGSLDRVRKAKEVQPRNDMHVENGAGGTGGKPIVGAKPALDKMPAHFHTFWEKTNTSVADREKEAAAYWKRQAERSANK